MLCHSNSSSAARPQAVRADGSTIAYTCMDTNHPGMWFSSDLMPHRSPHSVWPATTETALLSVWKIGDGWSPLFSVILGMFWAFLGFSAHQLFPFELGWRPSSLGWPSLRPLLLHAWEEPQTPRNRSETWHRSLGKTTSDATQPLLPFQTYRGVGMYDQRY